MRRLALAAALLLAACAPPVAHAPSLGPARSIPPFVFRGALVPLVTVDAGCYPPDTIYASGAHFGGQWQVTYRYPGQYRFNGQYFSEPLPWTYKGNVEANRYATLQQDTVLPWWVEYLAQDGRVYRVSPVINNRPINRCGRPA